MFTGLIEEVGQIVKADSQNGSLALTIACRKVVSDIQPGDSICVNGVCLTATTFTGSGFSAVASPETLSLTTLGSFCTGNYVNLERSMTLQSRLGGHMVQGHVDGIASVSNIVHEGDFQRWEFQTPSALLMQMVHKGSITVNGVSLTIAGISSDSFSVALIPKTIELTTFQHMRKGDFVNIETDVIGKYVHKYLAQANLTSQ